jgi:hypothetical protein
MNIRHKYYRFQNWLQRKETEKILREMKKCYIRIVKKCDVGNCTHKAGWQCLRCGFRICSGDCHDLDIKEYPGDGTDYCLGCAEYHEEYEEVVSLSSSLVIHDKSYFNTCDDCSKKFETGDFYRHFRTGEIKMYRETKQ